MFEKFIDFRQVVVFSLTILVTICIAQILNYLVNRRLVNKNKLLLKDPTRLRFFSHVSTAFVYVIGFATAISQIDLLKPLSTSLLAGAGLLTVAVSFASQNALSNIISGFFIVLFKPFGVNDRLKIKDNIIGVVEDITLRHTIIRDAENKRVIIPNSIVNNEIVVNYNFIEEYILKSVELLLHHDSNITAAKKLIRSIIMDHPKFVNIGDPFKPVDPQVAIPINITNVNEKGIYMQVVITGKSIVDSNKIGFVLFERLISELPSIGAYFVHQEDMVRANSEGRQVKITQMEAMEIDQNEITSETSTHTEPGENISSADEQIKSDQ